MLRLSGLTPPQPGPGQVRIRVRRADRRRRACRHHRRHAGGAARCALRCGQHRPHRPHRGLPAGAGTAGRRGGKLSVPVWRTYPLEEAARAHADLEAHGNRGKAVLLPCPEPSAGPAPEGRVRAGVHASARVGRPTAGRVRPCPRTNVRSSSPSTCAAATEGSPRPRSAGRAGPCTAAGSPAGGGRNGGSTGA
ncbi:zinc-binding dehydrogenase [Streptomyces sp. NC-S4]